MNKLLKQIATLGIMPMVMAALSGCTTAGPFVTNISSDGKGGLTIEKKIVHLNAFTGVITVGETPTTQTIQVLPPPDLKQK